LSEEPKDAYLILPSEGDKWRFGCQCHVRGVSAHLDLRMEVSETKLVGWTINLVKSILGDLILKFVDEEELVKALKKGREALKDKPWREWVRDLDPDELSEALDDKFKAAVSERTREMSYGEIEEIVKPYGSRVKEFFQAPTNRALLETKAPEPHEWINVKGRMEPGEVGATATLPGFFVPLDSGRVEFLAQKPYHHEYQFDGEVLKGKYVVTQLFRPGKWMKAGKRPHVWMMSSTLPDDLPYVISRRAVDKDWMPPEGFSALPEFIRKQVPEEYRYWKRKGGEAKEARNKLVGALKAKEVVLKPVAEAAEASLTFQLKRLWWKGATIIRGMPEVMYSILVIKDGKIRENWYFDLNPVDFLGTLTHMRESKPKILLEPEGELGPEYTLDPNKKIPVLFDTLDSGALEEIASTTDFKRYRFEGKLLKGPHVFMRRDPKSEMWVWDKSEPPKPKESGYAPSGTSGRVLGPPISLEDVLSRTKKIVLKDPFVVLTGGLAATGKSTGDADIMILWPYEDSELLRPVSFRLDRAYRDIRRHVFPDLVGPFTKYYPLYRLVLEPVEAPQPVQMAFVTEAFPAVLQYHSPEPEGRFPPHWDLRINDPDREDLIHFVLFKDPAEKGIIHGYPEPCPDKEWMNEEGTIRIPSGQLTSVKIVDRGTAKILSSSKDKWLIDFSLEHLKGLWTFEREDDLWVLREEDTAIQESFQWMDTYEVDDLKSDDRNLWIRGQALLPALSRNVDEGTGKHLRYTKDEIIRMARTARDKPLLLNHDNRLRLGDIPIAEEEDGKLEFLGHIQVPPCPPEIFQQIRKLPPGERKLSIKAQPLAKKETPKEVIPLGLEITEISVLLGLEPGIKDTNFEILVDGWR
jgi:hypothetical protein